MRMNKQFLAEIGIAVLLIVAATAWRVINNRSMIAPNLEIVTAVSLVAAVYLHRYFAVIVPLATMFLSDAIIGNGQVALFVWSAFLVIGLSGLLLKRVSGDSKKLLLGTFGTGLGAAVFFFVWTNFGVWAMGDGSFYPHTWQGLMACYAMGLPFFRNTLVSGVVLAPAAMAVAMYAHRLVKQPVLKMVKA